MYGFLPQIVLANPTAANLVNQLQLFDYEIAAEYTGYLTERPQLLHAIMSFIQLNPNYEANEYRTIINELLQFAFGYRTDEQFFDQTTTAVHLIFNLLANTGIESFNNPTQEQFASALVAFGLPNNLYFQETWAFNYALDYAIMELEHPDFWEQLSQLQCY